MVANGTAILLAGSMAGRRGAQLTEGPAYLAITPSDCPFFDSRISIASDRGLKPRQDALRTHARWASTTSLAFSPDAIPSTFSRGSWS
jgi:hypothetical protein